MIRRIDTRTDTYLQQRPYSVKQAAEATGKTKPTILRAIQANRIVARKDEHGKWQIDPAELHRVYRPVAAERIDTCTDATGAPGAPHIELLRGILDELRQLTAILTNRPTPAGEPPERRRLVRQWRCRSSRTRHGPAKRRRHPKRRIRMRPSWRATAG